jgi:hypothetical protein
MRTVIKAALSGITESKEVVANNAAEWKKLWETHTAGSKPAGKMPEIDFEKETVIVAAMGRKNTGGYSIEITKAEKVGDKLRVTVRKKNPPKGAMTIQTLTAPIHIVAVPKCESKVEFVEEQEAR